jgi:hypothetical protein
MIFAFLNSIDYPISRNHYLHIKKFSRGFEQNGYTVIELNKVEDILLLTPESLVYISSHYYIESIRRPFRSYLHSKLVSHVKRSKASFILWSFHDVPPIDKYLEGKNHIYLTENFSDEWLKKEHKLEFYNNRAHHKLIYSSYVDDRIDYFGLPWKIDLQYAFNYVGSVYQKKILNSIKNNPCYKSQILFYPPVQNEIKRLNSFTSSWINLVFHSVLGVQKGVITERFPEAMSMGNFIIHDHPRISKQYNSNGIVYFDSLEFIYETINRLKLDDVLESSYRNYTLWQNSPMSYRKQAIEIINKLIIK